MNWTVVMSSFYSSGQKDTFPAFIFLPLFLTSRISLFPHISTRSRLPANVESIKSRRRSESTQPSQTPSYTVMDLVFDMPNDQIRLSESDVSGELDGNPFSHVTVVPDTAHFSCTILIDGLQLRVPWDADIDSDYTGEAKEVLAEMYDSYQFVMERLWAIDTGCGIIQIGEEECTIYNSIGVYYEVGNVEVRSFFAPRSKPSTALTPMQCIHQILQVAACTSVLASVCIRGGVYALLFPPFLSTSDT